MQAPDEAAFLVVAGFRLECLHEGRVFEETHIAIEGDQHVRGEMDRVTFLQRPQGLRKFFGAILG